MPYTEPPISSTSFSSGDPARHPRVYFPAIEEDDVNNSGSSAVGAPDKPSLLGLGRPSTFRQSSLRDPIPYLDLNGRRRVRSAHAVSVPGAPRLQPATMSASNHTRRRTMTSGGSLRGSPMVGRGVPLSGGPESPTEEFAPEIFSDEYDLSHEDPRILEDVQRALKLKARREARLQARANPALRAVTSKSDMASTSSYSASSSPARGVRPVLGPPALISSRLNGPSLESEIDFSPSVGNETIIGAHPVPMSSNDGTTLDWAGSHSEDEKPDKRWSLRSKRKPKDKGTSNSSKDVVEKQKALYADKLARIRQSVKHNTEKKAEITRQQLGRRYDLLFSSLNSNSGPLSPTQIVRWYSNVDPLVQADLDRAEPLTWIKHLRDRRGTKSSGRSTWHVSALIAEEFVRLNPRRETMETIPENALPVGSPSLSFLSRQERSPSNTSSFDIPSRTQLDASLSRIRSPDGHVSFEPVIDAGRRSLGDDSQRSGDGFTKFWRPLAASPRNSVYSMLSGSNTSQPVGGGSPSSSRMHIRDIARRVRIHGTDSEASSSRHSLSEDHSRSDSGAKRRKRRRRSRPPDLSLVASVSPVHDKKPYLEEENSMDIREFLKSSDADDPLTAKASSAQDLQENKPGTPLSLHADIPQILHRSRYRTSLPSSERTSLHELEQRYDEESEHHEYERRAQLLDSAIAQNQRNRSLLQRVAVSVKEYDNAQTRMSRSLGLSFSTLPPELLDALSHDPAIVIGSTRLLKGWKAVEDIHEHIRNQQETIQAFLVQASEQDDIPPQPSILDHPLAALSRSLDALEANRVSITEQSHKVAEALAKVKEMHAVVKGEYNETFAHTSVVYPELSHIVALEESYKDHYQQFWELGMDALTFLLDTVTPVWRIYGKVIGIDIQDFLIIPWYRNEFTGEAKRYPILALPKRSLRHWIALILFFYITLATLLLQIRAALTCISFSRSHFITDLGLQWMAVPIFWIALVIQWCAVAVEVCIVAAECGVVMWWLCWWAKIVD